MEITKGVQIAEESLVFKYSRSSGPGGQNVNKLNTRVTLLFDVAGSPDLTEPQKHRIAKRLRKRISKEGVLRVISQEHRTQAANKQAALERLAELLAEALKTTPVRKKTRVPYGAIQRRLEQKKHRSLLKKQRAAKRTLDDN
jgi:ribosome-associated protein